MRYPRLPEPNEFGAYYFARDPNNSSDPAILPISNPDYPPGKYLLSLGEVGIVWDKNRFRAFDSPEEALQHLQRWTRAKRG